MEHIVIWIVFGIPGLVIGYFLSDGGTSGERLGMMLVVTLIAIGLGSFAANSYEASKH